MKIMLNHSSATPHTIKSTKTRKLGSVTVRRETHETKSTRNKTRNFNGKSKNTISNTLRRRAQAVIKDRSVDAQSRAIIRYGLATNDPWLAELVRRLEVGETIIETIVLLKHPNRSGPIAR
jgi:DNA primase